MARIFSQDRIPRPYPFQLEHTSGPAALRGTLLSLDWRRFLSLVVLNALLAVATIITVPLAVAGLYMAATGRPVARRLATRYIRARGLAIAAGSAIFGFNGWLLLTSTPMPAWFRTMFTVGNAVLLVYLLTLGLGRSPTSR
jgi:hypothetical protein